MQWLIRLRGVAALSAALLLVIVISGTPHLTAQETPQDDIPPELQAHLDDLEASVHEIRELTPQRDVVRRFPSRETVQAFIEGSLEAELTDDVIFEETLFYRAFDFVQDDFDLRSVYVELISDQVAGYYDAETKVMNTILLSGRELSETLPALEQFIYAHEYTHALQDQYFDLATFLDGIEEPDEALAALSLVEGDAMFVSQAFLTDLLTDNPGAMFQILAFSVFGDADLPPGTPPILEAELTMPYLTGLTFVTALINDGGLEALNAAFDNPPQSTEQIFHPEAYLTGEMPIEVSLAPVDLGEDWSLVLERTFGEFYLRQYLETQLVPALVGQAATGWGGDRYQLFHNSETDDIAWVMQLAWDTPTDAEEFMDVFGQFAEARTGDDGLMEMAVMCWEADDIALCLADLDGDSLLAVAPSTDLARTMIENQRLAVAEA